MTQEELAQKLQDIQVELHNLIMDGGVTSDSALYASMATAEYALSIAAMHSREYNEEFARIHINNLNLDQS